MTKDDDGRLWPHELPERLARQIFAIRELAYEAEQAGDDEQFTVLAEAREVIIDRLLILAQREAG